MVIKIGDIPWNRGLIGEEYIKHFKNGNPRKGRTYEELYGLKKAQEIKEIISKTHKGIHKPQKDSMRKKISETRRRLFAEGKLKPSFLGKKHTEETKKKIGETTRFQYKNCERIHPQLGKHPSKETIRKILKRRNMSTIEVKFNKIIHQNNLPYKFVGNGDFLIERKNPDFINTNGQKIAIEVYWRKHKEVFRNGLKAWQEERQNIFNQYGWTILFFDEVDVDYKVDKIIQQLQGKGY